ncbi:MAG: MFS transporter [Gammaproteobacteria bacterium]|nr:MFS transporter [Gammaproteobacteria bacterium]
MTNSAAEISPFLALSALDEQRINSFHLRMVFTAGMGFFTDAYDLFIIGVVTSILTPLWHLTTTQLAILNGASLASAALGAVFFGFMADKKGRKKMYGIEIAILFFGAILSAISPSFIWLLLARILVGLGIGGDYPTSAVVASEYSNRQNRGFLVLLVFAMQALGLVIGPSIASLFLAMQIPQEIVWRSLLLLGAIPAASVFFLRRKIAETPRFICSQHPPHYEVSRVVSDLVGYIPHSTYQFFEKQKLLSKKWLKLLIGTAGTWFLLDVAFYGNGVSSVLIMNTISPHASLLTHTLLSAGLFLCFAVPGYIFSALYVDKIGRTRLQTLGFIIIAICYINIGLVPEISKHFWLFLSLFGLSFFFINFGPNATTFLIPSEIFPTSIRAQAHGLSAAIGKLGAFIGVILLPAILNTYGLSTTMLVVSLVSIMGAVVTQLLPEMSNASLEASELFLEKM